MRRQKALSSGTAQTGNSVMNDAQNLKSEFMEWYIGRSEKTDGYFRRIFHGKPEKLESELDEYSEFFDFSIFDIGENNYKK